MTALAKPTCPNCGSDRFGVTTRYIGKDIRELTVTSVEGDESGQTVFYKLAFEADADEVVEETSQVIFCWDCNRDVPETTNWEEGP